jgi:hypothetical protein
MLNRWLVQPGKVKKLQSLLALSFITNLFLIAQSFKQTHKEKLIQNSIQQKDTTKINNQEILNFTKQYLNYFFDTGLIAEEFLIKHTNQDLFTQQIKPQIMIRNSKNYKSIFDINDSYIEFLDQEKYRVILIGTENFKDKKFITREITIVIEILYSKENFEVISIPRFEVTT